MITQERVWEGLDTLFADNPYAEFSPSWLWHVSGGNYSAINQVLTIAVQVGLVDHPGRGRYRFSDKCLRRIKS